jgi:protocatechuate 3,4-dioxygenase beta subunit
MKSAVLLLLAGACLCAQQQGSIEGIATNAVTHEPLSNVHVRLINASFTGINGAYGAMSDRAGRFSIATIRPGTYVLLPERAGFLHTQAKTSTAIPTITIKAGEHVTGYQLEMTPRAVLSGRVIDEAGDPVQGLRVQAVAVSPEIAPAVLAPAPNFPTDDRGEFRILGVPGKYYLQVAPNSPNGSDRPEVRSDGTSEVVYGTTFYPSSLRKDRATVVEAIAGKDVGGLEIRLARQQQGLSISGVVSGIPEGSNRPYVILWFGEKAPSVTSARNTAAAADGKFKFESLQPGFYRISAQYSDGKTTFATRSMEWTLENTDVSNVDLRLVPGLEVSGKVRMEGDPGTPAPKGTVKLDPVLGYMMGNLQRSGGELDADGMFRIKGIGPGRYKVRVDPLPEGAYVKTLEIDGAPTPPDALDLSNYAKNVNANLVIGRNGVVISGRVLDSNGEPMQTNVVMIYLVKEFTEMLTGNGTTQATPDGKYTLKGVAPGKYKLFAVDAFRVSGASAIDMLKDMFNRAEEVEFKEGDKITKDLRVTAKEDPNGKK